MTNNDYIVSFIYDVRKQGLKSCSYSKCQGWLGDDSGFYEQKLAPVFAKVRAARSELLHGSKKITDNVYLLDDRFADYSVKQVSQLIKEARMTNRYFMISFDSYEFVVLSNGSAKTITLDFSYNIDQVTVNLIKRMECKKS